MLEIKMPGRHDEQCNSCYKPSAMVLRIRGDGDTGGVSVVLCKDCAWGLLQGLCECFRDREGLKIHP